MDVKQKTNKKQKIENQKKKKGNTFFHFITH